MDWIGCYVEDANESSNLNIYFSIKLGFSLFAFFVIFYLQFEGFEQQFKGGASSSGTATRAADMPPTSISAAAAAAAAAAAGTRNAASAYTMPKTPTRTRTQQQILRKLNASDQLLHSRSLPRSSK